VPGDKHNVRVYLLDGSEVRCVRPSGTNPSAKPMLQPGQFVEHLCAENIPAVE
jgi:hypothetical protein